MHQLLMAFDGFAPAVTVLFPAAVLVGAVSVALRSHLRRTVSNLHDPLIDGLLVYSVLAAGYLVLMPQTDIEGKVQLFPGDDLWMALRAAPGDAQPWVQLAGNLLLLLPLGALVPLRVSWFDSLSKIAFGGLLAASCIEVIQLLGVSGRVASTDDVVLNTLGVAIGGLLVRGPWWQAIPEHDAAAVPRTVGPQHSAADQSSQTVWRLIEKLEDERGRTVSELPTTEFPAVGRDHPVRQTTGLQQPNRQAPNRQAPAPERQYPNVPTPGRRYPSRPSTSRPSTSREYPAIGKQLREPARHP